jgi:hypothetical protein
VIASDSRVHQGKEKFGKSRKIGKPRKEIAPTAMSRAMMSKLCVGVLVVCLVTERVAGQITPGIMADNSGMVSKKTQSPSPLRHGACRLEQ